MPLRMKFRVEDKASKTSSVRSSVKIRRPTQREEVNTRQEIEPIDDFDDDPADLYQDDPESDFEGRTISAYSNGYIDTDRLGSEIRIGKDSKPKTPNNSQGKLNQFRALRSEVSSLQIERWSCFTHWVFRLREN